MSDLSNEYDVCLWFDDWVLPWYDHRHWLFFSYLHKKQTNQSIKSRSWWNKLVLIRTHTDRSLFLCLLLALRVSLHHPITPPPPPHPQPPSRAPPSPLMMSVANWDLTKLVSFPDFHCTDFIFCVVLYCCLLCTQFPVLWIWLSICIIQFRGL